MFTIISVAAGLDLSRLPTFASVRTVIRPTACRGSSADEAAAKAGVIAQWSGSQLAGLDAGVLYVTHSSDWLRSGRAPAKPLVDLRPKKVTDEPPIRPYLHQGRPPRCPICRRQTWGVVVSTHVHRDGAHQITVRDVNGRELALVSEDHELQIVTTDHGPRLTPQMARDLANELNQWANCQQTVRSHGRPRH